MLHFNTNEDREYYNTVRREAEQAGALEAFSNKMKYLAHYGCTDGETLDVTRCRVTLWQGQTKWEFGAVAEFKQKDGSWKFFIGGAVIYRGIAQTGESLFNVDNYDGEPQAHRWSWHT